MRTSTTRTRTRTLPARPSLRRHARGRRKGTWNRLISARACVHRQNVPCASRRRRALARGLAGQVRVGEGQDRSLQWGCATSTSLVRARICHTTSAVRPTLLGRPPILAWRERGIIGKTLILAEDHELPIFALYSRTRTPRVVRIMHPKPKLNFNASEPDYGLLSELTMPSPRLIRCLFVQKGRRRASLRLRRRSRSAR